MDGLSKLVSDIKSYLTGAGNAIQSSPVGKAVSQASSFIKQYPAPINVVTKPIQQKLVTFGQQHPEASRIILKTLEPPVQKAKVFLSQPYKPQSLPSIRISSSRPIVNAAVKPLEAGYNYLVKPIAEGAINAPANIVGGATRFGLNTLAKSARGEKVNVKESLADLASVAKGIMDVAILPGAAGVGAKAIEGIGTKTLGSVVKEGAKSGAKFGATYNTLQGLIDNKDIQNTAHYLTNVLTGTAEGGVGGAVLGGGIAGASYVSGKVIGTVYNFFKKASGSEETAAQKTSAFIRDNFGRFAKKVGETPAELKKRLDSIPVNDMYGEKTTLGEWNKKYGQTGAIDLNAKVELPSKKGKIQPESVGKIMSEKGGPPYAPPEAPKEKYAFNINLKRVNLSPEEKQTLQTTVDIAKPILEKAKGKTLSNVEVVAEAQKSKVLEQITSREQTLQAEAEMLKARQRMVSLDKEVDQLARSGDTQQLQTKMKDLIDGLRVVSSNAADWGRKLQSMGIQAEGTTVRETVLKDVAKMEGDTNKILKEAVNVDWNNSNSIAGFYRKFVKPKAMEIFDEYRYNNMLSNPRTHLRNAFSNVVQTFITRPATIAATGDIKGAAKYELGALGSFSDAVKAFSDSFRGVAPITKPDIEHVPTMALPKFMTIPTRAMEAADKFFSALIRGGEMARGKTQQEADKVAEYSLFRSGLDISGKEGQGYVLRAIDSATKGIFQLGHAIPPLRWFVPFIRTPMNFAKQWIEYGPTGLTTIPGAANKSEQLAKTVLGSIVTAVGAKIAMDNRTTWSAPVDPKQKELFYATGRKPYSIKIGDKWVNMMYAGPFAMALALPAAAKYYQDQSRTALSDNQVEKLTQVVGAMAEFLSGQTFLEGVGNFVKLAQGDIDYSMPKNLAFSAGQVIPYEGLVRYVTTLLDPVYRKPKGFVESLKSNIPIMSRQLTPYTDPLGNESVREKVNYVTPYDVSTEQPQYDPLYKGRTLQLQINSAVNKIKNEIKDRVGTPKGSSLLGLKVSGSTTTGGKRSGVKLKPTLKSRKLTVFKLKTTPVRRAKTVLKLGGVSRTPVSPYFAMKTRVPAYL